MFWMRNKENYYPIMEALELIGPHFLQEYYIEATAAEKPLIVLYMLHHLKFRNVLCFTKTLEDTHRLVLHIWATSRENLSSGFPSKRVSNRSPQPQRLSRMLKFHLHQVYICNFPKKRITKALIRLRMRRLVCACVVRKPPKTGFLATRHIYEVGDL